MPQTVSKATEPAARRVQVLIVQDHPLLASAIARLLELEPDLAVSGVSASGTEALAVAGMLQSELTNRSIVRGRSGRLEIYRIPLLGGRGALA